MGADEWINAKLNIPPIINVPGDYLTIQTAINKAPDGAIIDVADGTYTGDDNRELNFYGKHLTLRSENGPTKTIIDCNDNVRAFIFQNGEMDDTIISGFTIKNGNSSSGGGMYLSLSSPTITNCIFINNKASNGAGMYLNVSKSTITNCVFIRNWVGNGNGGGIYCNSSSPKIINCTITKNTNSGIYNNQYSYPTIKNCIIWGNHWYGISNYKWDVSPSVTYSNIQGGYSGAGNINANPLFVGVGDYYHLAEGSPCIDTGDPVGATENDIEGELRPKGDQHDIGADEWIGAKLKTHPIIYVPNDYSTIQSAIDEAIDGSIILVADGTYVDDGNHGISFKGKHITLRSENGPTKTIIDCNDNVRAFILQNGEMDDTIISGFTIKNGNSSSGGGMHLSISSPTITNCIFLNNKDSNGAGLYLNISKSTITNCVFIRNWVENGNGGGIFCNSSSPSIINCTITKNSNGGIYNNQYSYPIIKNCIIWGNLNYGISNYKWDVSPNVTYSNVQSGYSGAGNIDVNPLFIDGENEFHINENSPCIDTGDSQNAPNSDIDDDERPQGKGYDIGVDEVLSGNIIYVPIGQPTIQAALDYALDGDKIIVADGIYKGSGNTNLDFNGKKIILQSQNGPKQCIIDCEGINQSFIFHSNESFDSLLSGFTIKNGKAERGGGIYFDDASPTITKCILINNSAVDGGGVYCNNSSPTFINCNYINNTASNNGGGLFCGNETSPIIKNCTFFGNISNNDGTTIYCDNADPTIRNSIIRGIENIISGGSPNISYSNIEGGFIGDGNIDADPLFADPANENFLLTAGSPCIDSGIYLGAPSVDIEEEKRPYGNKYDMGSDEYYPEPEGDIAGFLKTNIFGSSKGIADAKVTLIQDSQVIMTCLSNADGRYEFRNVPIGNYSLRIEKNHFTAIELEVEVLGGLNNMIPEREMHFVFGDITGDGKLKLSDVIEILKLISGIGK